MQQKREAGCRIACPRGPFGEALNLIEVARSSLRSQSFQMSAELVPDECYVINPQFVRDPGEQSIDILDALWCAAGFRDRFSKIRDVAGQVNDQSLRPGIRT